MMNERQFSGIGRADHSLPPGNEMPRYRSSTIVNVLIAIGFVPVRRQMISEARTWVSKSIHKDG